jgi:hypothetical protein
VIIAGVALLSFSFGQADYLGMTCWIITRRTMKNTKCAIVFFHTHAATNAAP